MNPIVFSTIIGGASFILTIFFAIYLNQRHLDKLMEQMDKRLGEMDKWFEARINESSARLETKISESSSRLEMKVEALRSDVVSMQKEITALQGTVGRIEQALFRPVLPPRG